MKTMFIPTRYKSSIDEALVKEFSKKLPKNLAIAYSIQFQKQAKQIKTILSEKHEISEFIQVIGCSNPKISKESKAILLIGSGRFHAISLAYETGLQVFVLENDKLYEVTDKDIESLKKREKAALMQYLNAKKVGILVSTKPGQENLGKSIQFKESLKDKDSYLFIANELNINEFENFPDIQSWVNTACPRMDLNESFLININDVKDDSLVDIK